EAKSGRALGALRLPRIRRRAKDRIPGLKAHLVVQRADDELTDGRNPAVMEKRPNPQVRIDSAHARRVHVAIGKGGDAAEVDAFAYEGPRHPPTASARLRFAAAASIAQ